MPRLLILVLSIFLFQNCAPISKQHGYVIDDMLNAIAESETLYTDKTNKNEVLEMLGSPSIKISDVDDVWIYLISIKEEKVFEKDEINFQQILRYQFDDKNNVISFKTFDQSNFAQIAFSDERTTITRDAYGISDQIYDAFTRGY